MNRAAVFHRVTAPYAYPVGSDHLRVVLQAARGDLVRVTVTFRDRYDPDTANQFLPMTREAHDRLNDYWAATVPCRRAHYHFHLVDAAGEEAWFGETGLRQGSGQAPADGGFQFPYIAPGDRFQVPSWLDGGTVFYQIFPDRFANGDPGNDPPGTVPWGSPPTREDLQGGDLKGIIQHIGHLQDLGVGGLYMTPIFASTSNHKYNTRDYYRIDPGFGDEDDLKALVEAAHERGIRVLLDAVFNHAGHDFFAFEDCIRNGRSSRYWDWFRIEGDAVRTEDPCNYETFATRLTYMPKLMTQNPEVAAYLLDVAEHWLRRAGIDGWRLDVANEVDHAFWRAFRQRVKGVNPEAWILGEIWHDSLEWLRGDQYDSVMNYPFRDALLAFFRGEEDAEHLDARLARLRLQYPWHVTANLLNLLGTHDTPRIRTLIGREKSLLAAVLMMTYPGVPLIYYGDEVGMEGGQDPGCRGAMDWSGQTWDRAALDLYRRLVQIRRAFPWLRDGGFRTLAAEPGGALFGFERTAALPGFPGREQRPGRLTTLVNGGASAVGVSLPADGPMVDLLDGETHPAVAGRLPLTLMPGQAMVLAPEQQAAAARLA
ncbi:MAG: glycoside hydrolase family 13 protein [Bacillota bacterium]